MVINPKKCSKCKLKFYPIDDRGNPQTCDECKKNNRYNEEKQRLGRELNDKLPKV